MRIPPGLLVLGILGTVGAVVVAGAVTDRPGTLDDPDGISFELDGRTNDGRDASYQDALRADSLRGTRVRASVELGDGPAARLSVVLATDSSTLFVQESLIPPRLADGWTHYELVVPVPRASSRITVSVALADSGHMRVRRMRLSSLGPIDSTAPLATAAQRELDSAIAIVRAHALRRDSVDWPRIEPEVRRLAAGARNASEVEPALRFLLGALGDHHSYLQSPIEVVRYREGTGPQPRPELDVDGGIGYIALPPHMTALQRANIAYARAVHDGMRRVAPDVRCGWIVDLRHDTGGNRSTMIAGLQPLLGSDTVGGFVLPSRRGALVPVGPPYTAEEMVDDVGVPHPRDLAALATVPVAVLTGPMTASAGEMVAIAFRGQRSTRSFGRPTAGMSTGIDAYALPSGAWIGLAASVVADRDGHAAWGPIVPDEIVAEASGRDAPRDAAVRWLRQQPGCSP